MDLEGLELPQAAQLKIPGQSNKKEEDEFILARSALTLATLPENLPCRDHEKQYLDDFLTEFFTSGLLFEKRWVFEFVFQVLEFVFIFVEYQEQAKLQQRWKSCKSTKPCTVQRRCDLVIDL